MQLRYAAWHFKLPAPSSFGNCYTHLASACDLAEDFLGCLHLLMSECQGEPRPISEPFSREKFLDYIGQWYDAGYLTAYANYHSKGKPITIRVPARQDTANAYMSNRDSPAWDKYVKYAQLVRQYRNVIVHDHLIGNIHLPGLGDLVPKKEKIPKYRSFFAIENVQKDVTTLYKGFILVQEQMIIDFGEIQNRLNDLWNTPIKDFRTLFLAEPNPRLLQKYNLRIKEKHGHG